MGKLVRPWVRSYGRVRLRRPKEVTVVREVRVPEHPFVMNEGKLRELNITQREYEVLTLVAAGLSNQEIGERLFISETTVKTHVSKLLAKLGASRRTQAVRRAREEGLLGLLRK